jgi:hypothetical protein
MLLALFPLTRVDILIGVGHDTFTFTEAVRPITVVHTDSSINHLANAVLLIVLPAANILVLRSSSVLVGLCEILISALLAFTYLYT